MAAVSVVYAVVNRKRCQDSGDVYLSVINVTDGSLMQSACIKLDSAYTPTDVYMRFVSRESCIIPYSIHPAVGGLQSQGILNRAHAPLILQGRPSGALEDSREARHVVTEAATLQSQDEKKKRRAQLAEAALSWEAQIIFLARNRLRGDAANQRAVLSELSNMEWTCASRVAGKKIAERPRISVLAVCASFTRSMALLKTNQST